MNRKTHDDEPKVPWKWFEESEEAYTVSFVLAAIALGAILFTLCNNLWWHMGR